MGISLKIQTHDEFLSSKTNYQLFDEYLTELSGDKPWQNFKDEVMKQFEGNSFFEIERDNKTIGFGSYKIEIIEEKPSFMLYEFYINKKYRSLKQLFEIRNKLIEVMRAINLATWYACVDNTDSDKINGYKGLGFNPMVVDPDYIYMGIDLRRI